MAFLPPSLSYHQPSLFLIFLLSLPYFPLVLPFPAALSAAFSTLSLIVLSSGIPLFLQLFTHSVIYLIHSYKTFILHRSKRFGNVEDTWKRCQPCPHETHSRGGGRQKAKYHSSKAKQTYTSNASYDIQVAL